MGQETTQIDAQQPTRDTSDLEWNIAFAPSARQSDSRTTRLSHRHWTPCERLKKRVHCRTCFHLGVQGRSVRTIIDTISRSNIISWSVVLESMPQHIFNFARKALIQQLPTASNLFRWKKIGKPECCLCNRFQSNKHVLANCSAVVSLERYTRRHNNILQLLAEWISTTKSVNQSLYVDIHPEQWISVDKVFQQSSRPDLVLVDNSKISILELTVCHESNLTKSKQYKLDKYKNIREKLQPQFSKYSVEIYSIEVFRPLDLFLIVLTFKNRWNYQNSPNHSFIR